MRAAEIDVALFCAMRNEAFAARSVQDGFVEEIRSGEYQFTAANLGGARCLTAAVCGFGPANLEACLSAVLAVAAPKLLINFGAAGAVRASLPIGAATLPREVVPISRPGLELAGPMICLPLPPLPARLLELTITRAGSSAGDLRDEDARRLLETRLGVDTIDCETYPLALRCAELQIPFLALRCVSDRAGAGAATEYGRNARSVLDKRAPLLIPLAEWAIRERLGSPIFHEQ